MSKTFNISRDYYEEGQMIFKKKTCTLESGITVLVGCNGSGKSTLLKQIAFTLKKDGIPYVFHDAHKDDSQAGMNKALFHNDFSFVAALMTSSEGENVRNMMADVAKEMGKLTVQNPDAKELWFLFDALDSGLSIDGITEIKTDLFQFVIENNPNKDVYIVVSTNSYEFANGERCYDVANCKEVSFKDYSAYRKFILKSREQKDGRNKKWWGE